MSRLHDHLTGRIKKPEPTLKNQAQTFEQMLEWMDSQSRKTVMSIKRRTSVDMEVLRKD